MASRLRIVGGTFGGRMISGPPNDATRPTSERVREAIGSILEARNAIDGARVLELFAGTGAVALELLSRGAKSAVLVESDRRMAQIAAANAAALGVEELVQVEQLDLAKTATATRLVTLGPFDLAFIDPPYDLVPTLSQLVESLSASNAFAPGALVLIEHATKKPPPTLNGLEFLASYRYGDSSLLLGQVP